MIYLKNNTETQSVYIPRQTVLGGGYIATTKTYEDGLAEGIERGKEIQKGQLLNLYVTENGEYEREDGWGAITVNIPREECPEGGSCNLGIGEYGFDSNTVGDYELYASDDGYDGWSKMFIHIYGDDGAIKVFRASGLLDDFANNIEVLDFGWNYYVGGIITEIQEIYTLNGNYLGYATYILDNGFKIYRGKWIGGNDFNSEDQIKLGAYVIVFGRLQNNNGELGLEEGSQVVAYQECAGGEGGSCNLGIGEYNFSADDVGTYELYASDDGYDGWSKMFINIYSGAIRVWRASAINNGAYPNYGNLYVGGIITEIQEVIQDCYKTYVLDNRVKIYKGGWFDGSCFNDYDKPIKVGDYVIVYGVLQDNNGELIIEEGSQVIAYQECAGGEGGSCNLINPIVFSKEAGNTINAENVQIPTFVYEGNQYYNVNSFNLADIEEFKIHILFKSNNSGYAEPINIFGCEDTDWDNTTFGARIYQGKITFKMSGQEVVSPHTENTWYDVEMGYNTTKRWVIVNGETLLDAEYASFNKPSQTLMIGAINSGGNAFRPFYGKIAAIYIESNGNQVWLLPKEDGTMNVYWNNRINSRNSISGENNARFENDYISGDGMKSITWLGNLEDKWVTPSMSERDGNGYIVVSPSEGYNGLKRTVINPQTLYNEGVEAGRTEGEASLAAKARVLNVTENGVYKTKFSDPIMPTLVTGVYDDGTKFYNYAELNGKVFNTKIPTTIDSRIELWYKGDNTLAGDAYNVIMGANYIDHSGVFEVIYYIYSNTEVSGRIGSTYFNTNWDENVWHHIVLSKNDGFVVDGVKIGDMQNASFTPNGNFLINGNNYDSSRNANGCFGMIKIDNVVIIPTADGFKNVNTGELLEVVKDGDYIFTKNLPTYGEGEIYKTINVNVPTAQEQSLDYDITAFTYKVYDWTSVNINRNNMTNDCGDRPLDCLLFRNRSGECTVMTKLDTCSGTARLENGWSGDSIILSLKSNTITKFSSNSINSNRLTSIDTGFAKLEGNAITNCNALTDIKVTVLNNNLSTQFATNCFNGLPAEGTITIGKNVDVTITDNEITSFFRTIVGEGWTITIKQ